MKNLAITILIFLLTSCEWMMIPVEPYVITKSEGAGDDLFKYTYVSTQATARDGVFLSRSIYAIGDTISFNCRTFNPK